jgi:hypothetical protein
MWAPVELDRVDLSSGDCLCRTVRRLSPGRSVAAASPRHRRRRRRIGLRENCQAIRKDTRASRCRSGNPQLGGRRRGPQSPARSGFRSAGGAHHVRLHPAHGRGRALFARRNIRCRDFHFLPECRAPHHVPAIPRQALPSAGRARPSASLCWMFSRRPTLWMLR